ncbi:MAG: DegT/DnrJ/EryC1/StrS family aminotransferase [Lachnospiraceae bacterium]|nr:DegT/DnrJ/EryC1/StrS family aminotransferase [Lachnospiraceae bacterium]
MRDKEILVTRSSMPPYEEYIEAIRPLWDSHWITNMGRYHKELEKELKEYLKVPEVSLMVNGHMALELTIQAMGFPAGSEVITTPFTFISTTHAIVRNGLEPVFCDIKESDGTIDEEKIEALITEKTVAVVPVHVYGNICNVEAIQRIADKYNLKVIYDAAHAFGETYKGAGVSNFGDASVFSFHATKVFNTIEGGAVTFQNHVLYEKLFDLKNFGIRGEELACEVGANAKMNEFAAIMGLCNLKYIGEEIEKRRRRTEYYRELLADVSGVKLFQPDEDIEYNAAYLPIMIDSGDFGCTRDELFAYLRENKIKARKYFYPLISNQVCYRKNGKGRAAALETAEKMSERILTLPLYADLDFDIMDEIVDLIKQKRK